MIKFSSILSRYEAAEFSQAEAASYWGLASGRSGAGVSVLRMRAKLACLIGGWVRPRQAGSSDRSEEVEALYRTRYAGFHGQAFS